MGSNTVHVFVTHVVSVGVATRGGDAGEGTRRGVGTAKLVSSAVGAAVRVVARMAGRLILE